MSAPHTNIEKQRRRHWGPLVGMAVVVLFAIGMLTYWLIDESAEGQSPQEGTGAQTEAPSAAEGEGGTATGGATTPAPTDTATPTEADPQSDGETSPTQQDVTPDPATVAPAD